MLLTNDKQINKKYQISGTMAIKLFDLDLYQTICLF